MNRWEQKMASARQAETYARLSAKLGDLLFFVLIIGYALRPEIFSAPRLVLFLGLGVTSYGFAVWLRRDRQ